MHEILQSVRKNAAKSPRGIDLAVAGVLDDFLLNCGGGARPSGTIGAGDPGCADPGGSCSQPDDHIGAKTLAGSDQGSVTGVNSARSDGRASATDRGESPTVFG